MKIYQSSLFARKVKKLKKQEKQCLDDAVLGIVKNPKIGEEKKGDLSGIYVCKFKVGIQQYLLSYQTSEDTIELITFGTHENYYRDLKNYIK
jgi:mRNA-degrading endonuclease RelE of RelBE toxin-antitoxin system